MGQYDRALPLYEVALEIRKSELGDRHPSTAQGMNNLALLYYSMGQYDQALPLSEGALEICKSEFGLASGCCSAVFRDASHHNAAQLQVTLPL